MKSCLYCNTLIIDVADKRKFRLDKKFCNQKCHDKFKYENASKQAKGFKDDFGLNKYTMKGIEKKLELIKLFGGKCELCGYNKNIAAFDFHHKDPDTKNFEIKVQFLKYKNDDEILEEAKKCMLLCANCHRELHNPFMDIEHVKRVLQMNSKEILN
jgi:hypothetical protein